MKVVVRRDSLKQALRWSRRILFTGAVLTVGYCGFVLLDAWIFERRQTRNLERLSPSLGERPVAAVEGLIGKIEIPRVGLSAVVVEGTDKATLRRAAGHIQGTAIPGQPGNIGIAAHRDTFFRPLRNVRLNDIVALTTSRARYHYRVVSMRVVGPTELSVLNPSQREILTLVSCYPFYFIGPAPNRFIVRAERVTERLESQAPAIERKHSAKTGVPQCLLPLH
jgi:sortase A